MGGTNHVILLLFSWHIERIIPYVNQQVPEALATCAWHATHCVSDVHGDEHVAISSVSEAALCNECLVQVRDY